jgi:nicotinate-nucleotide--dimethylbenzimidazole phosphoribosyltransferase
VNKFKKKKKIQKSVLYAEMAHDQESRQTFQAIVDGKAKPPGSLGFLEECAVKMASIQCKNSSVEIPRISADPAGLIVFCGDHGIVSGKDVPNSVSAYPQIVSEKIFKALGNGGAAGVVLAESNGLVAAYIVDVGLNIENSVQSDQTKSKGKLSIEIRNKSLMKGTRDYTKEAAMTVEECQAAMNVGGEILREAVEKYKLKVCAFGEVGIGNTTSAAAITAAITGKSPDAVCGRGSGLDDAGLQRKIDSVAQSLQMHGFKKRGGKKKIDPLEVLRSVGGVEIAAMAGAMLECKKTGTCIVVDGFISCAAALIASKVDDSLRNYMFFSHKSEETGGVSAIFEELEISNASLDLKFRLGEGTGAVLAISLLRSAAAMFNNMISLEDALKPSFEESDPTRIIKKDEIDARGSGTTENFDTYRFSLKSEIRVFFTSLMFLTRLPCPSFVDHHPAYILRSMLYYPIVGSIIGAFAANFFLLFSFLSSSKLVGAAGASAASVWLTGCFHEDGLADVFDGYGGGWGKEQILRIMQDSRIGTYGMVGTFLWLVMKIGLLSQFENNADIWTAIVSAQCIARFTVMPMVYLFPYLVDSGDAKGALYNRFAHVQSLLTLKRMLLGAILSLAIVSNLLGFPIALMSLLLVSIFGIFAGLYSVSMIGGVVGDFLGASICLSEVLLYFFFLIQSRSQFEFDPFMANDTYPAILSGVAMLLYSKLIIRWQ